MKKAFLCLTFLLFVNIALADTGYTALAPIDGYVQNISKIDDNTLGEYLDGMFKLGIALCTGLAVLMIIIGGIQYVSSDAWSKKTDGRERIFAALTGLLIALGSWVLLNTISPRLVSTELSLQDVKIEEISTIGPRYAEDRVNLDSTPGTIGPRDPNFTPTYNEDGSMRVRSTYYYAGERYSDPDTDALRSSTGVRLRAASATTVGVAAVDPALIPYGSRITINTPNGPRYYIAADRGSAVVNRTASGGREPVIDFYNKGQVGNTYDNVVIDYYRGGDFTNLSKEKKESFFVLPSSPTPTNTGNNSSVDSGAGVDPNPLIKPI